MDEMEVVFFLSTSCMLVLKPDFLIAVSCVVICVTIVTERLQGHSFGNCQLT